MLGVTWVPAWATLTPDDPTSFVNLCADLEAASSLNGPLLMMSSPFKPSKLPHPGPDPGRGPRWRRASLLLFSRSSHAWLCDPMDCNAPGLPVPRCLPKPLCRVPTPDISRRKPTVDPMQVSFWWVLPTLACPLALSCSVPPRAAFAVLPACPHRTALPSAGCGANQCSPRERNEAGASWRSA